MTITTLSSRELSQKARNAAKDGPVLITNHGKPAHVLLSHESCQQLKKQRRSIVDALAMPKAADIDFEAPRISSGIRPADLDRQS
ncbi:MAG TPA: type II toxin-antitoxin system prevent-host-death family antitoxin [Wenzhouxiangella sp.]|nr:type II toxin-antitoxin system prevent-host-death family antitoxin [Wenzhouxiangella sp.]